MRAARRWSSFTGRAEQEAIGNNFMARDRVDQIVQEAFLGAGSFAAKPEIRRLLATHGVQRRP